MCKKKSALPWYQTLDSTNTPLFWAPYRVWSKNPSGPHSMTMLDLTISEIFIGSFWQIRFFLISLISLFFYVLHFQILRRRKSFKNFVLLKQIYFRSKPSVAVHKKMGCQWNQVFDTKANTNCHCFYRLLINTCTQLVLATPQNKTQNNKVSPKRGRKPITRNLYSGYSWYQTLFSSTKNWGWV